MKKGTSAMNARFMRHVAKSDTGCWLWTASKTHNGYGQFQPCNTGLSCRAHKAAWQLMRGEVPSGLKVLHTCDVRHCVNPEHLYLGTDADNTADMMKKGRGKIGSSNGNSKLAPNQVAEIRLMSSQGWSNAQIAAEFGISAASVSRIRNRKVYCEVP